MIRIKTLIASVMLTVACQIVSGQEVKTEKLLETSQSWDGTQLPAYPATQPKITILKTTIPPGTKLATHYHLIINCAVVLKGTLKIVKPDGKEKIIHAGDAVSEVIGEPHYGINEGDVPVELIVFYAGDEKSPLSEKVSQ